MDNKKNIFTIIAENRFIHILISIALGFVVGALFLVVMGLSVGDAYGSCSPASPLSRAFPMLLFMPSPIL